jgi:hypothetical protein
MSVNIVSKAALVKFYTAHPEARGLCGIQFKTARSMLFIRHVFTHPEYDQWSRKH